MEYTITNNASTVLVKIQNDVTFDDHNTFRSVIDNVSKSGFNECIVDMRDVQYIDSAGLGMLLLLHDEATKNHISVTIYPGDGQVARVMELAKLDAMFKFVKNVTGSD